MRYKTNVTVTVTKDIAMDIKMRRIRSGFNCSVFFETRYRAEFMNVQLIEKQLRELEIRKDILLRKREKITKDNFEDEKLDPRKCRICNGFYHENFVVRQRVNVYSDINVCRNCFETRKDEIKTLIETKKKLEEKNHEKENNF